VYPCGQPAPVTSSLNFAAGQVVPNLVATRVGTDGKVCFLSTSVQHILGDATAISVRGAGGISTLASPLRILDTRSGVGGPAAQVGTSGLALAIRGAGTISAFAKSVLLNVTAVNASYDGYAAVFPCGSSVPSVSNVNFVAGEAIANAAVVRIGAGGDVCVWASTSVDMILDISGVTTDESAVVTLEPKRIYDSREGQQPLCNRGVRSTSDGLDIVDLTSDAILHHVQLAFVPTGARITLDCRTIVATASDGYAPLNAKISIEGQVLRTGGGLGIVSSQAASGQSSVFAVSLQAPWRAIDILTNETLLPLFSVPGDPHTVWSPVGASADGSLYAFSYYDRSTLGQVVVYFNSAGDVLGQWTPPFNAARFRLSPNGNYLAFDQPVTASEMRVKVVTLDGTIVATGPPNRSMPTSWLGNGTLVLCSNLYRQGSTTWSLFSPPSSAPPGPCLLDGK
jgi:hypothetical protein